VAYACSRGAFFGNKVVNYIIGTLCMLITLTPFESWQRLTARPSRTNIFDFLCFFFSHMCLLSWMIFAFDQLKVLIEFFTLGRSLAYSILVVGIILAMDQISFLLEFQHTNSRKRYLTLHFHFIVLSDHGHEFGNMGTDQILFRSVVCLSLLGTYQTL
jgi:hypothetical protein